MNTTRLVAELIAQMGHEVPGTVIMRPAEVLRVLARLGHLLRAQNARDGLKIIAAIIAYE